MTCRLLSAHTAWPNFFPENGTEQHPSCWNFKGMKIFDTDRLKRHGSVTAIGNAAADTDLWPNKAVRDTKYF
jgi:hypothetical protein